MHKNFLRDLIAHGEDLIGNLLSELTSGMVNISDNGISFDGGPFGEIQGVLDKFGLDFTDMITVFLSNYNTFKADLLDLSHEKQQFFNLKPISLPRFPSILQIGSKKPSLQYSVELKNLLWDKLNATFSSSTFNGVKIPNVPSGSTFAQTFSRGEFSGKRADFLE